MNPCSNITKWKILLETSPICAKLPHLGYLGKKKRGLRETSPTDMGSIPIPSSNGFLKKQKVLRETSPIDLGASQVSASIRFDLNPKVQLKKQILLYNIFHLNKGITSQCLSVTLFCNKQRQKSSSAHISYGEDFVSKGRFFDSPNCGNCIYKGSSYCWGQCSLNIWKRDRFY
jgi:hypothetical protein